MTPEEFKRLLEGKVAENRAQFEGQYKAELNELLGLSKDEINEITPDLTDMQIYDQLITVVKEASKANIEQAQLLASIQELGEVAVKIAKKVPSLSAMFA
ncbi:MAG TPA: hypothetical protein ENH92_00230 [Ectothiorhodospiraceae bacterium]|nr:hypothetical protein [Ectothiorhodospiraceae bacterium]